MKLTDLPHDERPREKLRKHGSAILTDAELLALLLGSGYKGRNVLDLARSLLTETQGLRALLSQPYLALAELPGLGPAKAAMLAAIAELSARMLEEPIRRGESLNAPKAVSNWLRARIGSLDREVFVVLFVDSQNRLIQTDEISRGTVNQTHVYPREVVRRALQLGAVSAILAHNHPSGVCEPSQADQTMTDVLKRALALIDVRVLDHIIVAGPQSYSFAEHGLI